MKIYIIGHRNIDVLSIGILLQSLNDSMSVSPKFTSEQDKVNDYTYFLDKETINISYKNNSLITVTTTDNESSGMTYDDYYNNDIFCLSLSEFNVMPDRLFRQPSNDEQLDILVVWVDSSKNVNKNDITEAEYLTERINNLNFLYFCNETNDFIVNVINDYLLGNDEKREELLQEYN